MFYTLATVRNVKAAGPAKARPQKSMNAEQVDEAIGKQSRSSDFANRKGLCYRPVAEAPALFPGSSVVEQPAVNRLVAGSNPARGAK